MGPAVAHALELYVNNCLSKSDWYAVVVDDTPGEMVNGSIKLAMDDRLVVNIRLNSGSEADMGATFVSGLGMMEYKEKGGGDGGASSWHSVDLLWSVGPGWFASLILEVLEALPKFSETPPGPDAPTGEEDDSAAE